MAATGLSLFIACFFLIRRRMRKRGTGFFFYLEYVWLPLVILAAAAYAWSQVDTATAAEWGIGILLAGWIMSFLVIGIWAIFLPILYVLSVPVFWCLGAMVLGITGGNMAGIGWELWTKRGGA
ncbi:hypothetical protein [Rhizobium sp.]